MVEEELSKIWQQVAKIKELTAVLCQRIDSQTNEIHMLRETRDNHAQLLTQHTAILDCVRENSQKVSAAVAELTLSNNRLIGGIKVVACSTFLTFIIMMLNYAKGF
jgi:hypothetical protein